MRLAWFSVPLIILFSIQFSLQAQTSDVRERFQFDTDLPYDQNITSPSDFLGYEPGEEYTFHHQVIAYFKQLDKESDKITVKQYGETYEGRSLIYAVLSSEENMSDIEMIRMDNLKLANEPEVATIADDQPVVVWMSYNVHGNEPSSSEAAMQTAYRLIAATDSETNMMLRDAVVVIDPMINPDGRDRYVYWYKSSRAAVLNTDASDLEHDEIWPGGRTNHYWFDLNRDWTWLVHPESRGRIAVYQQWMPSVHIDFHEQGYNNNYFTMPGTTPRNHELPDAYEEWADVFGRGAIKEFDKAKVNYETRERFDFFYPGYGSSYPSVMGGIGMLAEQGGHSRGGRAVETNDGYVLTLRQRVFDHYKNGISIVRTSANNRQALLEYLKKARSQETQKGSTKAYVLADNEHDHTYHVINILMQHGVEVQRAKSDFRLRNAYDYWDGERSEATVKAGSFIISTDQPEHLFINTLMRRELEIRDSVMYDMSTWSVPLAYNLEAWWTTSDLNIDTELVAQPINYEKAVRNPEASYAYVVDWKQRNAPRALAMLWEKGYKVRSAEKNFQKGDEIFSEGSIVILKGRNMDHEAVIDSDMKEIAEKAQVVITGFDTGRMEVGSDLGSPSMRPVKQPKVALMIDEGFSSYTAGQLWFLFDQWTGFGISRIRSGSLRSSGLSEYDVILMPGGYGLNNVFDESTREAMKQWVRSGGVLIGTESSATWLTSDRSGITPVSLVQSSETENEGIDPAAYTRYADRSDSSGLKRIPGAAFKGLIDQSHPLAFGMPEKIYSLKFSADALTPDPTYSTVGYYVKEADKVMASGYASNENKQKAAGMGFAAVHEMGRGKVVFLLDNTQYRMFWVGPSRMVQNAVMLLPGF